MNDKLPVPGMTPIIRRMTEQVVIPVVRAESALVARNIVDRLVDGGLDVIELTTTVPSWQQLLSDVIADYGDAAIGMGTVTDAHAATEACTRGAKFVVSPFPAPAAREVAIRAGTPFIGGGFTPREIAASAKYGMCKLFPASQLGTGYLSTLKSILPNALIMPTGGIRVDDVPDWLSAGASAVGIGSDLYAAPNLRDSLAQLRDTLAEKRPR